ncbi:ankyrin repeat and MYND domain-containing protein 1 isoform X3 [Chiloscyllium plagiosum]|uniref:ankyrin repeat and MYND domain-containing protein 1 isoform X3 n=1 Tax=Chiloscyllium plagiosum TaxID=36176 RepID=UPI001CB8084B|nr:ankyrin repeat and MYND domain-containing protein 1 isoform X3 [Chiloscyllium plagiosum]
MSSPGSPSPGLPTHEPPSPEQQQQQLWEPLDSPEPMQPSPAPSVSVMPSLVDVGLQEWPNGWRYEGQFEGNMKHGHGIFQWASGEYYVGSFYKDHRHGHGIYVWPDGSKFTGMFYLDRKDGYGTLEMKDGAIFQGLYKADERFGPGVLTYPNGRQDVGLWYRNHLIRLCTEIPGTITMKDHPLYYSSKEELTIPARTYKEKYFWRVNPEEDPFFYPFKKLLFDDNYTLPAEIAIYSTDADHLPLTRSYTKEGDRYFFQKEELGDEDEMVKLPIVNQTPLLVQMQIHIYRHRHAEAMLSWDVAAVIAGNREGFGPRGPLECSSEQLITAAREGNQETVLKILKTNLVSADVADVNGHFSLIGAAAVCNDSIINLLLDNGANVNKLNNEGVSALNYSCIHYYPSGCFLHNEIYRLTNKKEIKEIDGLTPLHVSVAIPGKQGVLITELLLNAAANPNEGAYDDDVTYEPDMDIQTEEPTGMILKSPNLMGVPPHYFTPSDIVPIEGGRTPLHIACQREDNHKDAHQIVRLLLLHKANPNLLWSGHSPLSLAIASGNDPAVNELLANGAEPNLPLTHGLGSAMCTAVSTRYEHKRSLTGRLALILKLLEANANILMPITLTSQVNQAIGTAVDFAYHKYFQDSRIAQTPYHALTHNEREVYNARRELLNFLSNLFRKATVTMERKRFEEIIQQNMQDREIDSALPPLTESEALSFANISLTAKAIIERNAHVAEGNLPILAASEKKSKVQDTAPRRQLFKFKFCYACGRSVGVRLITCSRCKEVYYCSKACKVTAWNEFHKDECYLTKGRPSSKKDGFYGDAGLRSGSSSPSVELDNYSYI